MKKNANGDKKNKRRRVALACEGCRQRKTRCDGVQPTCGICQKRKISCVYGKRYTRAHVSVDYVKSLEEKLGILSNDGKPKSNYFDRSPSVASTHSIKDEDLHDEDEDEDEKNNEDYEEIEKKSNEGSETNTHIIVSYPDSVISEAQFSPDIQRQHFRFNQTESSEYSTTDAMGAGSGTHPNVKNKDKSFYGKSAAMSFMKELFVSVDGGKLSDEEVESSRKCKYKMTRSGKPSNKSIDSIKLPPRSVANNYVKNYFDYAYPLYPFIHKPTFMAAYEEIWSAGGDRSEVDELFYSIVNVIFAFGYRLSPTGELLETNANANVSRIIEVSFNGFWVTFVNSSFVINRTISTSYNTAGRMLEYSWSRNTYRSGFRTPHGKKYVAQTKLYRTGNREEIMGRLFIDG